MKNKKPEITFGSTTKGHIDMVLKETPYRISGEMCIKNFDAVSVSRLTSDMQEESLSESEKQAVIKSVKKFQRFKPCKIIFRDERGKKI